MKKFVIYSPSEDGYWNNELGWVDTIQSADLFSQQETIEFKLPLTQNNDAIWKKIDEHNS